MNADFDHGLSPVTYSNAPCYLNGSAASIRISPSLLRRLSHGCLCFEQSCCAVFMTSKALLRAFAQCNPRLPQAHVYFSSSLVWFPSSNVITTTNITQFSISTTHCTLSKASLFVYFFFNLPLRMVHLHCKL